MSKLPTIVLLCFLAQFLHPSAGEVGTASYHSPPYSPTACYGSDPSQFPSSNMFGSAGEGIWDNGAACGRQYLVSCLSGVAPKSCRPDQTIQITIIDRDLTSVTKAPRRDTTLVLTPTAYAAIANTSAPYVNVEFLSV